MDPKTWEHVFAAERSRRYHLRREAFLLASDRISAFALIVLGSAVVANLSQWTVAIGLAVTALGASQIAFQFASRARDHHELAHKFAVLLAEIRSTTSPTEADYSRWQQTRISIEHDEPPLFHAVEADAYNEVVNAYIPVAPRRHLPWYIYPVMHLSRFESWRFLPQGAKSAA